MRLADVLRELFPVLAVLFLLEGIGWSSAGQLVLWRPGRSFKSLRTGFRLLPRLPWDQILVLDELQPFATIEGVFWPASRSDAAARPHDRDRWQLLPWREIGEVVHEQSSLVLGKRRLRLVSPAASKRQATLFSKMAQLPEPERAELLWRLRAESLDLARMATRRAAVDGESFDPRLLGSALLAVAAGVLPFLLWPEPASWRVLAATVALLIGLWLLSLLLAAATRRRLSDAGTPLPAGALLALTLSPPAAALTAAAITREAYDDLDPSIVAAALLPAPAAARVLRRRAAIASAAARRGEDGWRRWWQAAERTAIALMASLPEPSMKTPGSVCPVCASVFRAQRDECPDCGVPLAGDLGHG